MELIESFVTVKDSIPRYEDEDIYQRPLKRDGSNTLWRTTRRSYKLPSLNSSNKKFNLVYT